MKLAREMERRLERLVDGATAAVFRGTMHPVDMADRLMRQADFAVTDGEAGPEIPNRWTVRIHPSDLPPGIDADELNAELARAVTGFAAERGLRTNGPIAVTVATDGAVPRGLADCSGSSEPGPIEPWAQLVSTSPPLVAEIRDNRCVIGRSMESDAVIAVPELSRTQAMVVREGSGALIIDLHSANGTFVNGVPIGTDPVTLVPGDTITMGDIDFVFRPL